MKPRRSGSGSIGAKTRRREIAQRRRVLKLLPFDPLVEATEKIGKVIAGAGKPSAEVVNIKADTAARA